MNLTLCMVLLAGGLLPPGETVTRTAVEQGRVRTEVLSALAALDDTTINLDGSWAVTVNAGNFSDYPEPDYVVRLSGPGQSNTFVTRIVVLDRNLRVKWSQDWGILGNQERASVTVADIDRNGYDDIIFPVSTQFADPPNYKTRIYAVDGRNGQVKPGWPYILPGWPDDPYDRVFSEVVAADLNGNDTLEIVFMTTDFNSARKGGGHCYALSYRGDSLWRFTFYPGDTINQHGNWTSPAVVDLNGDGRMEVICHVNLHSNTNPWPLIERRLFILNHDGSLRRSWQTEGTLGRQNTDYASPVVADISGNGAPEIVIVRRTGFLDVFDTLGTRLPGFPVDLTDDAGYIEPHFTWTFSSPSVADLDDDGRLEIVVGSFGLVASGADWGGHIHVFKSDGSPLPGFPYRTRNAVWHSPGIGNADSLPGLEILTAGCDSSFYVVNAQGESLPGWPKRGFPTLFIPDQGNFGFFEGYIILSQTPYLADVGGDGLTDILMSGTDGLFYLWNTTAEHQPAGLAWPTHRFDRARTGAKWSPVLAVGEQPSGPRSRAAFGATVVRGSLSLLPAYDGQSAMSLLNAAGRKVMELVPGENDVRHLAPGIYFVRVAGPGRAGQAVQKVVIQR